jgi:hypothetical protein
MKKQPTQRVTLSGDVNSEYLIRDRRPDGELVLVPDASADAMLQRVGGRAMTEEEFAAFEREHGPFLPPDGEG